jgi:hypothetical protein
VAITFLRICDSRLCRGKNIKGIVALTHSSFAAGLCGEGDLGREKSHFVRRCNRIVDGRSCARECDRIPGRSARALRGCQIDDSGFRHSVTFDPNGEIAVGHCSEIASGRRRLLNLQQ